jgi:hypothetical protein
MPAGTFTRSVGMRLAIVGTASLQAHQLDEGLALGHRALDILEHVSSVRAKDYVRDFLAELTPWRHEPPASEFSHRASQLLSARASRAVPPVAATARTDPHSVLHGPRTGARWGWTPGSG